MLFNRMERPTWVHAFCKQRTVHKSSASEVKASQKGKLVSLDLGFSRRVVNRAYPALRRVVRLDSHGSYRESAAMQTAPFGQILARIKRGFPKQEGQDMMIAQSPAFDNLKRLAEMSEGSR